MDLKMNLKKVRNMNTLKAMAKRGLIKLDTMTGSKITRLYSDRKFTCYYIWDGPRSFEYKGEKYVTKYVDGCFKPYVFKVLPVKESSVKKLLRDKFDLIKFNNGIVYFDPNNKESIFVAKYARQEIEGLTIKPLQNC